MIFWKSRWSMLTMIVSWTNIRGRTEEWTNARPEFDGQGALQYGEESREEGLDRSVHKFIDPRFEDCFEMH